MGGSEGIRKSQSSEMEWDAIMRAVSIPFERLGQQQDAGSRGLRSGAGTGAASGHGEESSSRGRASRGTSMSRSEVATHGSSSTNVGSSHGAASLAAADSTEASSSRGGMVGVVGSVPVGRTLTYTTHECPSSGASSASEICAAEEALAAATQASGAPAALAKQAAASLTLGQEPGSQPPQPSAEDLPAAVTVTFAQAQATPYPSCTHLLQLPQALLETVANRLPGVARRAARLVCKDLRRAVDQQVGVRGRVMVWGRRARMHSPRKDS